MTVLLLVAVFQQTFMAGTFVFARYVLLQTDPFAVAFLRYIIAATVLFSIASRLSKRPGAKHPFGFGRMKRQRNRGENSGYHSDLQQPGHESRSPRDAGSWLIIMQPHLTAAGEPNQLPAGRPRIPGDLPPRASNWYNAPHRRIRRPPR